MLNLGIRVTVELICINLCLISMGERHDADVMLETCVVMWLHFCFKYLADQLWKKEESW